MSEGSSQITEQQAQLCGDLMSEVAKVLVGQESMVSRLLVGLLTGGHVLLHDSYFGCDVQSSVLDFVKGRRVQHVRWPYIIPSHWNSSCGSIAHFIKEG